MVIDLNDIQKIRKRLGITQKELAKHAGVSQSLIAKIENGLIDPSYRNAVKIINALDGFNKRISKKISKIMTKKVIWIKPDSSIRKAVKLMKDNSISQIPVMENGICIGLITEADILNSLSKDKVVSDVMEECPPIVVKETSFDVVALLLKYYPLILVAEHGKLIGVVTKTDLISNL